MACSLIGPVFWAACYSTFDYQVVRPLGCWVIIKTQEPGPLSFFPSSLLLSLHSLSLPPLPYLHSLAPPLFLTSTLFLYHTFLTLTSLSLPPLVFSIASSLPCFTSILFLYPPTFCTSTLFLNPPAFGTFTLFPYPLPNLHSLSLPPSLPLLSFSTPFLTSTLFL